MEQLGALFELISKFGVAVVFAMFWYLERQERREVQRAFKESNDRIIEASQETSDALRELRLIVNGGRSG
jgi:hypothetical protein